jgi:hypothetical protein
METLDANFKVLQETLNFYIDVFVIKEPQLTILVLNYLNYLKNCQIHYGLIDSFNLLGVLFLFSEFPRPFPKP